ALRRMRGQGLPGTGARIHARGNEHPRGPRSAGVRGRRALPCGESRIAAAVKILTVLDEVGLGYLSLGQPLTTLSGGERQRLKLAVQLSAKTADSAQVIILDEPTTGLHLADVDNLLRLLDDLVDAGRTVIVIEHHQAVMAHADHIIDLGPGAGHDGGRIVFEGSPTELVAAASEPGA